MGNSKPLPVSNDEVKQILMRSGDIKADKSVLVQHNFRDGMEVRINEGPFESFTGTIEEVNLVKQKLRVMVGIFGRGSHPGGSRFPPGRESLNPSEGSRCLKVLAVTRRPVRKRRWRGRQSGACPGRWEVFLVKTDTTTQE